MTPDNIVDRIVTLYPNAFSSGETIEQWRLEFNSALKGFTPMTLDDAWDELIDTYTKGAHPKPADIKIIAKRIVGDHSSNAGNQSQTKNVKANSEAYDFTTEFMRSGNPVADNSYPGGYWQQLRAYVRRQALQQIRNGEAPNIKIPQNLIEQWKAENDKAEAERKAKTEEPSKPRTHSNLPPMPETTPPATGAETDW